ncbi:hypothetical protein F8S09_16610 [Deinococcus sp. SDU3-2]|uniref:Uncharacterized protein n=1 Tax=Deinococcus terrestris TaxID=2651870 RepID=A0A7X1NZQ5_9DEIO|nr:hypothetical protein [Deinococcus terrestris]MPY68279.1 hypothetical protein [Deinococcus terrestris]
MSAAATNTRKWNVERLIDYLWESLEPRIQGELGEDVAVRVVAARQPDIRLNDVKIKGGVTEWKAALGEAIGDAMGDIEPEDFLNT